MKITYLILAIVVLYFVFVSARIIFIVSTAHLPVITQADRTVGSGPKLKYIAAGDSTAVGVGASSVEKTYAYQLTDHLATKNTVEYHNIGVAGAKTQDIIDQQLFQIAEFNPDVITISIGANDLTHLKSDGTIIQNYKTIIKELTEKTHAKIYITDIAAVDESGLFPWFYQNFLKQRANSLNAQILKMETDRVKFVHIHAVKSVFAADQFHPSDEGYKNWTNAFLSRIKTAQ